MRKTKGPILSCLPALVLGLALAGPALAQQPGPPPGAGSLKIGWLGPLTGDSAIWGNAEYDTLKMLVADLNAQGGIRVGGKPYRLVLIGYDDVGDPMEALTVARRLTAKDKVVAILGPQGSGEAIPIAPLMEDAKVPCIATTATNPRVTVDQSGRVNPYMFRTCFIDPYQGRAAASYAYKVLGLRQAALLVTEDDPYSTGLGASFAEAFEGLGGRVVSREGYYSGDKEFGEALGRIGDSGAEMVFLPGYYFDVALIAKQARDMGLDQLLMGGDGWPSENLVALAGNSLEGSIFINHLDMDSPAARALGEAYTARYGMAPDLSSCMAHDAFLMLVDALQRADSLDGRAIKAALEATDIEVISGRLRMGRTHDPEDKTAWLFRITGSRIEFLEAYTP